MKNKWSKSDLGMLVGMCALGLATAVASAKTMARNDTENISQAQISLGQAISTAQSQVPGTVSGAKLENEKGQLIYEVKIISNGQTSEVKVDAKDGKVLSSQIHKKGQGDGDGEEDDDNGSGGDGEQDND